MSLKATAKSALFRPPTSSNTDFLTIKHAAVTAETEEVRANFACKSVSNFCLTSISALYRLSYSSKTFDGGETSLDLSGSKLGAESL
jgi:hypothetical protein